MEFHRNGIGRELFHSAKKPCPQPMVDTFQAAAWWYATAGKGILIIAKDNERCSIKQKTEETTMILADKIIRLRKKNGWSQEELAEKMQVSRQAVSKWKGLFSVFYLFS